MKHRNYQSQEPCLVCATTTQQRTYHHVKSRGSGGGDEAWNLLSLCLRCHNEIHKLGINSFAKKYPQFKRWLVNNNWEQCPITNKWLRN